MEEDDDEFGDLYADVLQSLSSIQNPNPTETLATSSTGGDQIPIQNPCSDQKPIETPDPIADEDPNEDWLPDNWNDDNDDDNFPVANFQAKIETEARVRVSAPVEDDAKIRVSEEEKMEIRDLNQEPVIPRLSTVPSSNNGDFRVSNSEDWDSDSEDDLQIVLNDSTHMPIGGERIEDDDNEELVIVTSEDQHAMENHAWGEGDLQPSAADGEIKDGSEAAKANGAAGIGGGLRIGYSSHGLHLQHHSMFKYIRPGAAAPGAPAVVTSGQIHPPSTMSSIAGRGRSDWRHSGIGGIPGAPKSFHSGFRPGWANNSSRAFGGGLDFTLPSYKTVFDIDIEIFEEKPWRHPGVDISDYFNFGLDEDNWKEYSKQLDQLRLESTMQSKIRVYESGRSEQAYDPDLPPELAAATGHHDISDNINHVKIDNGQSDLSGQGRDASYFQAPFPTGRAIQVETGYSERLPSIDTRLPRPRDTDVVIEIALQDPMEDSTIYNSALALPEKNIQGEVHEGVQDAEGDRHNESEYYNRFPHTLNGYQREMGSRRISHAPERDGSVPFPPESPLHYNPNSRLRSPVNSAGSFGTHRGGRLTEGASHGKYSSPIANHTKDSIPTCSTHENRPDDHHIGRPGESMGASHTSEQSPAIAAEMAGELSIEQKDGEDDGMLALDDGIELEETSDLRISGETPGDGSTIHSYKKKKLSSQVEQTAIRDSGEDDDLRATRSDNSITKSGSSNQKRCESGDVELQKARSMGASDLRRHHDDLGRDGRREMDRMRMGICGRQAMHHSYPHRDWEPYSAHPVRGRSEGLERPRETDRPFWQSREDDIHSRRMDEDIRRERKIRVGDRNDKDDAHLTKRLDDGDWRGRNREGGPKLRERDDVLHHRDKLDEHHAKRKDEDHLRRERTDKEDSSRRKRDGDDNPDNRKREDGSRMREKAEEHHSSRHKDESWHQREREDRQRLKHPHEDPLLHGERTEGRVATRSRQITEDKSFSRNGRNKSDCKVIVSDKDNQHRDKRHHKGREDAYARVKNYNNERSSRHERLSAHSSRLCASDNWQISRERQREGTRRNKDSEIGTHNPPGLGKRKYEDRSAHHTEKVSSKGVNEQESSKLPPSSEKEGEEDLASDDEGQHECKRGRSKMERWTSHKEREYNDSDIKDIEGTTKDIIPTDELRKTEGNDVSDSDRHMNTVEKLKRRSERFKLSMPVEKDVASLSKRSENEAQLTQNEALAGNEVKPERPARKRRWTAS